MFIRVYTSTMRSKNEHELFDSAGYRDLQLLTNIESDPMITQRQLSRRVGIALGLTNVWVRNLAKKGYIRAHRSGWKRWIYTLTPEGFSLKFRMTINYVGRVLEHYRTVRQTLRETLQLLPLNEESNVAICGIGEYAELVYLGLKDIGIEEISVYIPDPITGNKFLGMTIRDLADIEFQHFDLLVLACLDPNDPVESKLAEIGAPADKIVRLFRDRD